VAVRSAAWGGKVGRWPLDDGTRRDEALMHILVPEFPCAVIIQPLASAAAASASVADGSSSSMLLRMPRAAIDILVPVSATPGRDR
jgi:hypothetical protein